MNTNKYLIFEVKNQKYAVSIRNVKEIIRMVEINSLPMRQESCDSNRMEGAIFLRGEVISIFSMAKQLGYDYVSSINSKEKILITEVNGSNLGFIIDDVKEVREIEEENLQESLCDFQEKGIIQSILIENNDMFSVVDIERCLSNC